MRCQLATLYIAAPLLLISQTSLVFGEEILKKEGGEYLGFKTGDNEFRTCKGTVLEIGKGKIQKTSERCPPIVPPKPAAKPDSRLKDR